MHKKKSKEMRIIDSKTINKLSKKVSVYLKKITPETPYWNGKMTWIETVNFRNKINKQIIKSSFGDDEISNVLYWGGIRNFHSNNYLPDALEQIKSKNLKYRTYSRISSFSKLFSFYDPQNYFILDARVSLVLNVFFKEMGKSEYTIPFNHKTAQGKIARIHLSKFKDQNAIFKSMGVAYFAYNQLILDIFKKSTIPKNLPSRPEIIEMAFFSMFTELTKTK